MYAIDFPLLIVVNIIRFIFATIKHGKKKNNSYSLKISIGNENNYLIKQIVLTISMYHI